MRNYLIRLLPRVITLKSLLRTPSRPIDAATRPCVRTAAVFMVFPLVNALPSTCSAKVFTSLFAGFSGTMLLSDFREPFMPVVRNFSFTGRSLSRENSRISRFPCKRCPHMPGSKTPPGRPVTRIYATARVAFPSGPRGRHPRAGDFGAQ